MAPPVLRTDRLLLRPRVAADFGDCLAMDREPGTTRWIMGPWDDAAAHEDFIRSRIAGPYPEGQGYWVIAPLEDPGRFLGWVLLIPEDGVGPRVETGWRLVHAARGDGYAAEAAEAALRHGFTTLDLPEVVAEIHRGNAASRRVAEKIGMRPDPAPMESNPDAILYVARSEANHD